MRGTDLNLKELLQVDPAGGILRFGNERVLLLSGPVDFGIGAAIGTTTGTQTPPTSSPEWTNFIPAITGPYLFGVECQDIERQIPLGR